MPCTHQCHQGIPARVQPTDHIGRKSRLPHACGRSSRGIPDGFGKQPEPRAARRASRAAARDTDDRGRASLEGWPRECTAKYGLSISALVCRVSVAYRRREIRGFPISVRCARVLYWLFAVCVFSYGDGYGETVSLARCAACTSRHRHSTHLYEPSLRFSIPAPGAQHSSSISTPSFSLLRALPPDRPGRNAASNAQRLRLPAVSDPRPRPSRTPDPDLPGWPTPVARRKREPLPLRQHSRASSPWHVHGPSCYQFRRSDKVGPLWRRWRWRRWSLVEHDPQRGES